MQPASRILVTGATGFVGNRVCQAWPEALKWPGVDLRDRDGTREAVGRLLEESSFDAVLHLAAAASVQDSFQNAAFTYEVNLMGTVHLLEALGQHGWQGRFLLVSSGAVYEDPDKALLPLTEESRLSPCSPYAVSKQAAELACLEWGRRQGVEAMVARPSNHTGPGQTDHYFLPSMARQITAVPRGEKVVIETGNLAPYRDFLHVDDVVEAYRALLREGSGDTVYNVARGISCPLEQMLEGLIRASGRDVERRISSQRFRSESSRPLEISTERLRRDTAWSPRRELEELYSDLICFWETR